jgi:TPR repeat protein
MAAALGDAEAELNLARMYSTGHGVPRDDVEAAKWLRRAADQGRVVAQTVLAAMYIAGRGVVKSDTEAVTWERKAADQGYAAARACLEAPTRKARGHRRAMPRRQGDCDWFTQGFDAATTRRI